MATASPSSGSEHRGRPARGRCRGQTSPTAALVAVATIGIGLSLHATVLAGVVPTADRDVAEPTLERVHDTVVTAGVADRDRLDAATAAGPDGYHLRVSLRVDGWDWTAGPTPPSGDGAERTGTAERHVAIRTGAGRVETGLLRVEVWR